MTIDSARLAAFAAAVQGHGEELRLSVRELEALWFLVDGGLTNPEIATAMGIAQKTVETHLHHARVHLGILPQPGTGRPWRRLCIEYGRQLERAGL